MVLSEEQQAELRGDLLSILRTFSPKEYDKIQFGGDYYYIIEIIRELSFDEQNFSLNEISLAIKKSKVINKKTKVIKSIPQLIEKLIVNNLINENNTGFYSLPKNGSTALGEFIGTLTYTRKGRSGLLRHISKSTKRLILWHSLSHPNSIKLNEIEVEIKKIAKGTNETKNKKAEGAQKILNRFITKRVGYLRFDCQTETFKLANERKSF
jgi:hypothetical protein